MQRLSPSRFIVITSILFVLAAIAINANWGSGFGFNLFTENDVASSREEIREPASPFVNTLTLAPVNISAVWNVSSGNWSTAANWTSNPNFPNNGQPGAGDLYDATLNNGGSITLDIPVTIQNFILNSGTVNCSNSLTINQFFDWFSGTIAGAGSTDIASGGVMNHFGNGTDYLTATTLNNAGTINFTSGSNNLYLSNAATIQNNSGGVFDLQNSGNTFINQNGNSGFYNNAGATLRKSSTGVSDLGVPLTNSGIVDVQNGTLNLNSGGYANNGAIFTGAGAGYTQLSGGALYITGTATAYRFDMAGGTLIANSASSFLIGAGGIFDFHSGTIAGAGSTDIASGGVMNHFGNGTDYLTATTLNNAGTINFTSGSNNLYLSNAATIQNNSGGVFDLQNSGNTFINQNGNSGFYNNAGATLRKSSTGVSDLGVPLTNSGIVDVQNGTLNLNSGGYANNGAIFTGAGAGYTQLSGGALYITGTATAYRFDMAGGTLIANSASSFLIGAGGIFDFHSGTIAGAGSTDIASGGVMNHFGNGTDYLTATTLNNAGTINFTSGSNNLYLSNAATIQNNSGGVFDLQNSGNTFINQNGNSGFYNNAGATLRKSSTGVSDLGVPLTNSGIVDVQDGTLNINYSYTQTAGVLSLNGASFSASGPLVVNAGQMVGNGTISPSLNNNGGTISPGFSVGTLTVTGNLSFGGSSAYNFELNSNSTTADQIVANGVFIASSSTISLSDLGSATLPLDTVFVMIDNTSGGAIAGRFSNLADNSRVAVTGNTFKVNYSGGDGNDLTLTTLGITGTVTYGNAIGNPVPPRFVKNVSLSSTAGSPSVGPAVTGTPGTYLLSGFGAGSYTIKPTKPGGANVAISSADAARVAQGVSGSVPFVSDNQRFAADTSGNGTISSTDASKIAQFVTGLPFSPPNFTGQWRFFISNLPAFPAGAHPQERTYASVTSSVTGEDYIGLLIGETTGNYNPASHARPVGSRQLAVDRAESSGPVRGIDVELPQVMALTDKEIVIPVSVQGAADKEIFSYEFDLRYDPAVIQPHVVPIDVAGTVSRGLMVVANPYEPGLLRVVVYGPFPIDENGVLLYLRFTIVGASGSVSPLTFERMMFNEGEPRVVVSDGRVEISY